MKVANISFQFAKAKHIFGNKHDNLTNCEIRIMHFIIYVRVVSKERGKDRERAERLLCCWLELAAELSVMQFPNGQVECSTYRCRYGCNYIYTDICEQWHKQLCTCMCVCGDTQHSTVESLATVRHSFPWHRGRGLLNLHLWLHSSIISSTQKGFYDAVMVT